jgi:hypothetical protein
VIAANVDLIEEMMNETIYFFTPVKDFAEAQDAVP